VQYKVTLNSNRLSVINTKACIRPIRIIFNLFIVQTTQMFLFNDLLKLVSLSVVSET